MVAVSKAHNVRKNFRFTEAEAALLALHAAKAGVTESEYVRRLVTDPAHVFVSDANLLAAIYRELKHQGVNLNQIAFAANSRKQDPADIDAVRRYGASVAATLADVGDIIDSMKGARDANR